MQDALEDLCNHRCTSAANHHLTTMPNVLSAWWCPPPAWHRQPRHHSTASAPMLGRHQLAPPWHRWRTPIQASTGHTTTVSLANHRTTATSRIEVAARNPVSMEQIYTTRSWPHRWAANLGREHHHPLVLHSHHHLRQLPTPLRIWDGPQQRQQIRA